MLLIDSDGNRLLAKYYQPAHADPKQPNLFKHPFQSLKEQRTFEAGLWDKTRRANGQLASCLPRLARLTSPFDAMLQVTFSSSRINWFCTKLPSISPSTSSLRKARTS